MNDNSKTAAADMWQILNGFYKVGVVRAFVELGLADKVGSGFCDLATLAETAGTSVEHLTRLLRAATAVGLCTVQNGGEVSLTRLGQTLCRGAPESMAEWVMFVTAPWITSSWLELTSSIRTGHAAFPVVHGVEIWQYLAGHPRHAELFHTTMAVSSADRARVLRNAVDLSSVDTLVDVGGGHGQLLAMLLGDLPHLHGILADREEVLAVARDLFRAADVADRVEFIPTDFFTSVPTGGDAYVLSRILHDWPDNDAMTVLRVCREAMHHEARLYIIERVVPDEEEISDADRLECALEDLDMLVLLGGKERTAAEFERLFGEAGFQDVRFIRKWEGVFDIIEARPT